jgi:hypothetical protein
MATRYLQTQHRNRQGKTSGDGRSIWNGYLKTESLTFDISSRGTGATILSPGAQQRHGNVATGDQSHGYSCGLADLDEMLGSAVMSEIFYRQGIPTAAVINHHHRITGDAVTWIIEEVIAMKGKIKTDGLQEAIDAFIDSQVLIPGKWQPVSPEKLKSNTLKSQLLQKIQQNLETYKESI